jgi:hypothetical protein
MSGRMSRNKGANAEREWCAMLKERGFSATRNRIGAAGDDVLHNVPNTSFEVKRQERLMIPDWLRQAREQAGSRVPVLVFRRSAEPWHVALRAEDYLDMIEKLHGEA